MSATAIAATCMLLSAFGHAVMNTFNKGAADKVLFRGLFLFLGAMVSLPFTFFLTPPSLQVWMHLGISFIIHGLYTFTLMNSLQKGDMGLVYPIMRGLAPVLAALVALVFLRETLPFWAVVALMAASFLLVAFAWPGRGAGLNLPAVGYAVMTAVMIACYSVNDAAGVRAMREAGGAPLTYIAWFFVSVSLPIALICFWLRRRVLRRYVPKIIRPAIFASLTGFMSYSLALYAFSLAPVGAMVALRETSVVFGAILAAIVLKEPLGERRIVLAALLAICLVVLQIT